MNWLRCRPLCNLLLLLAFTVWLGCGASEYEQKLETRTQQLRSNTPAPDDATADTASDTSDSDPSDDDESEMDEDDEFTDEEVDQDVDEAEEDFDEDE